jgi:hypothetical protein
MNHAYKKWASRILFASIALLALGNLGSCAMVPQKDREYLSDPLMQLNDNAAEASSDAHNFPRREGSSGGSAGAGGGCGC